MKLHWAQLSAPLQGLWASSETHVPLWTTTVGFLLTPVLHGPTHRSPMQPRGCPCLSSGLSGSRIRSPTNEAGHRLKSQTSQKFLSEMSTDLEILNLTKKKKKKKPSKIQDDLVHPVWVLWVGPSFLPSRPSHTDSPASPPSVPGAFSVRSAPRSPLSK